MSVKKVSTLMPNTCALALPSWAIESRNVHSSFVHTPLNAAGKNASTTGLPCSSLSVTGSRSWFVRVKSGAFDPTATAIKASITLVIRLVRPLHKPRRFGLAFLFVADRRCLCDRGSTPHETLRPRHRRGRRQLPRRARRDPRVPRTQRRRQDDDDADPDRLHAGHRRQGHCRRVRRLRPADRGQAAHRLPAGDAAALPGHERLRVSRLRRQNQRRAVGRPPRRASST